MALSSLSPPLFVVMVFWRQRLGEQSNSRILYKYSNNASE